MTTLLKSRIRNTVAAAVFTLPAIAPAPAHAGADPYVGELMLVGFTFCPRGWATAEGQLLAINQNQALFSLLGTTFGGNGTTNFALPDLRGSVPLGQGQGPGLSSVAIGERNGTESATLLITNMPAHNHAVNATNLDADKGGPADKILGAAPSATEEPKIYHDGPANKVMSASMIGVTGGSQPFSIRNPYLGMMWCIALQGVYPT